QDRGGRAWSEYGLLILSPRSPQPRAANQAQSGCGQVPLDRQPSSVRIDGFQAQTETPHVQHKPSHPSQCRPAGKAGNPGTEPAGRPVVGTIGLAGAQSHLGLFRLSGPAAVSEESGGVRGSTVRSGAL